MCELKPGGQLGSLNQVGALTPCQAPQALVLAGNLEGDILKEQKHPNMCKTQ